MSDTALQNAFRDFFSIVGEKLGACGPGVCLSPQGNRPCQTEENIEGEAVDAGQGFSRKGWQEVDGMALPVVDGEQAVQLFPSHEGIDLKALPQELQRGFIVLPLQQALNGSDNATGMSGKTDRRAGGNERAGLSWVRILAPEGVARLPDPHHTVALAFSGGLDSRLLAALLRRGGVNPLLFHIFGPHSIVGESALALRRACEQGFSVVCLPMNPLEVGLVRANGERRCYYCKYALFKRIREVSPLPVCDGTLASDLREYRPGLQALYEHGVISPLALAGFDKVLVERAAHSIGLESPGQMSQSCLLTRFGYGVAISDELLRSLAAADVVVRQYLEQYCRDRQCEVPYQSLRLPKGNDLVLHLEGMSLPPSAQRALRGLMRKTSPALPALRVETVARVKGFYDRQQH